MKKSILFILFLAFIVFLMSACGSKKSDPSKDKTDQESLTETEKLITEPGTGESEVPSEMEGSSSD